MSKQPRSWLRASGVFLLLMAEISLSSGCDVGREFRTAALPAVHTGVSSILNGLLDGLFAAIEPEPNSDDSGS